MRPARRTRLTIGLWKIVAECERALTGDQTKVCVTRLVARNTTCAATALGIYHRNLHNLALAHPA